MAYRAAKKFEWSEDLRERLAKRHWRCPRRLVTGTDDAGTDAIWPALWRSQERTRGGGTIASLLPVLALYTFPGRQLDDLRLITERARKPLTAACVPDPAWTPWAYVGQRTLGGLAGVDKNTVGRVFDRLGRRHLLQRVHAPRLPEEPDPRVCFRLSAELFSYGPHDPYFSFPGNLVGGGLWALMPSKAMRQLFITIGCLDPILNEQALSGHYMETGYNRLEDDEVGERIKELRASKRLSLGQLERFSGLKLTAVRTARDLLTTPTPALKAPLVQREESGDSGPSAPSWYAVDRDTTQRSYYPAITMNDEGETLAPFKALKKKVR